MATEKFTNEKTIKLETSKVDQSLTTNLSTFLPKKSIRHKLFRYIFYCSILLITLLSLAKIPYCGSYIDAYIFEFVIGTYSKFIAYLFLIIFCICKLIDSRITNFLSSKNSVIAGILLTCCAIILSSIFYEFTFGERDGYTQFSSFLNIGKAISDYLKHFQDNISKYINHFTPFVWFDWSAGFVGSLIPDLYGIILVIIICLIGLILAVIAILLLTNQTKSKPIIALKKWIIKRFETKNNMNKNDELDVHKDDIKPDIFSKSTIKQEAITIDSTTPPISFLSETSIDNYLSNKSDSKTYGDTIAIFLRKFDSIIHLQNTIVSPLYCEINFEVEKVDIVNDILRSRDEILNDLKLDSFNVVYKNNIVRFEIANKNPSKISLKSIFSSLKNVEQNKIVVGVDENTNPLLIDIVKKQNIVLLGTLGSGASMLMTTMMISLAYCNNPKKIGFVICSPSNDKALKHLNRLPHLLYPIKSEQREITEVLINMQKEIENRELLFKKNKSQNLENYNNQVDDTNYLKRVVLSISNFNLISKISVQNHNLIIDILKRGPRVGICTILFGNNVDQELLNEDLYKEIDIKLLMKLEFEQESIQILGSTRAKELFGNGDGYFFDTQQKQHIRFQGCYMNVEELIQIIKVMETFYTVKSKLN